MNDNIQSALNFIHVADISREDWIQVGMALKQEGFSCDVWDEWSRNDRRYHEGECQRLWNGFRGNSKPVTGGTIVHLAESMGWDSTKKKSPGMDWTDAIEDDSNGFGGIGGKAWDPVQDLITYLELLFKEDEYVGYVTTDVYSNDDGRWLPKRGVCFRRAGDMIASLKKHPDDIAATIGDWNPECGAWIRFNPLDGNGISNNNVTAYRYALVESDTLSMEEQSEIYRDLALPIAALVSSGNKSLHAIVRIDASDKEEYRKRVAYLYKFLAEHGAQVDQQNSNPSRLSRMPGVTRNGNRQQLLATNIGRKSWTDWKEYITRTLDDLPEIVRLSDYKDIPTILPEELIAGVLRCGHKMLISGPSKAGKSFLLMELCIAIAEGTDWLGFHCKQGRVLYVNLEIDPNSAIDRMKKIYAKIGINMDHADNIRMWNLRGYAIPLSDLVPKLIHRVQNMGLSAVIIDPIYKVITGDENSASDMGKFCNQFDKICTELECSVVYCHHHSKGAQGAKKAMDRASGSGVFARDPDAQLDMVPLDLTREEMTNGQPENGATAYRLESNLREFANFKPKNLWFRYPVHELDDTGELDKAFAEGSPMANLTRSRKYTTPEERHDALCNAFNNANAGKPPKIAELAAYANVDYQTIVNWVNKSQGEFTRKNGRVFRGNPDENED